MPCVKIKIDRVASLVSIVDTNYVPVPVFSLPSTRNGNEVEIGPALGRWMEKRMPCGTCPIRQSSLWGGEAEVCGLIAT